MVVCCSVVLQTALLSLMAIIMIITEVGWVAIPHTQCHCVCHSSNHRNYAWHCPFALWHDKWVHALKWIVLNYSAQSRCYGAFWGKHSHHKPKSLTLAPRKPCNRSSYQIDLISWGGNGCACMDDKPEKVSPIVSVKVGVGMEAKFVYHGAYSWCSLVMLWTSN